MLVCSCSVEQEDKCKRSGVCWDPCSWLCSQFGPKICDFSLALLNPGEQESSLPVQLLGLECLVSQQCWTDCKCKFRGERCRIKMCWWWFWESNLCIIILLLLRTISHVLFIKSFEYLLVEVPSGTKGCSSSAWTSCFGVQQPCCCAER